MEPKQNSTVPKPTQLSVSDKFSTVAKSASGPDDTQWAQLVEFVNHLTPGNLKRLDGLLK